MKYFKNVEAATIYRVSEKSVRNWIGAARKGKIKLDLYEQAGKYYLANTARNQAAIKKLVERGQKYKNSKVYKVVTPKPEFYELFGPDQIFNILSGLDVRREIPLQYTYVGEGAQQWDEYAERLSTEEDANVLTSTVQLLKISQGFLSGLIKTHKRINIVDLGIGNALPVRDFLKYLLSYNLNIRYIGIDVSKDMLQIAAHNIDKWFKGRITFEPHVLDISKEEFGHMLTEDAFYDPENAALNIILLFGGTLINFRTPHHVLPLINHSLGRRDLLIYADKLDSPAARRYFDFRTGENQHALSPRHRRILELLNIDESLYEAEQFFDEQSHTRFIRAKLKVDLHISFTLGGGQKLIKINKGEAIVVWRALHQNDLEVIRFFDDCGFNLQYASKTPDQEYLLTISKVKTGTCPLPSYTPPVNNFTAPPV